MHQEAHARGECRPCSYYLLKADGCIWGDDCKFCHLCDYGAVKRKKKAKRRMMKAMSQALATTEQEAVVLGEATEQRLRRVAPYVVELSSKLSLPAPTIPSKVNDFFGSGDSDGGNKSTGGTPASRCSTRAYSPMRVENFCASAFGSELGSPLLTDDDTSTAAELVLPSSVPARVALTPSSKPRFAWACGMQPVSLSSAMPSDDHVPGAPSSPPPGLEETLCWSRPTSPPTLLLPALPVVKLALERFV